MSAPVPVVKGSKYNGITLLREISPYEQPNGRMRRKVEVECHCGAVFDTMLENLYAGYTKSCGCAHIEHGMSRTKFKYVHTNMKARCDNPQHPQYSDYGGRGIKYCEEWRSFQNFMNDMHEGYKEGLTLDRREVNEGYCKENCRWVGMSVQGHNKRKKEDCLFVHKGVNMNVTKTRFVTRICSYYLATFDTLEDAAKAYDDASEMLYQDRPNGTQSLKDSTYDIIKDKLTKLGIYKETV